MLFVRVLIKIVEFLIAATWLENLLADEKYKKYYRLFVAIMVMTEMCVSVKNLIPSGVVSNRDNYIYFEDYDHEQLQEEILHQQTESVEKIWQEFQTSNGEKGEADE